MSSSLTHEQTTLGSTIKKLSTYDLPRAFDN